MSYGLSKPPCKLIQLSFPEGKREEPPRALIFWEPGKSVNRYYLLSLLFFPFSLSPFFSSHPLPPSFLSFFIAVVASFLSPFDSVPCFSGAKNYFRAIERFTRHENTQPINLQAECFKALNRVQRGSFIVAEIAFSKLVIWKMILFDFPATLQQVAGYL